MSNVVGEKLKQESIEESNQEGVQVSVQVKANDINTLDDISSLTKQKSDQVSGQVSQLINREFQDKCKSILNHLKKDEKSRIKLLKHIGLSNHTKHKRKYIDPLLEYDWIKYTIPENVKDRNQKYVITETGLTLLNILQNKTRLSV